MDKFILHSAYQPTGDQPQAIEKLTKGVLRGDREQVLLGVTGSGKTFTMANVIANVNKPTLVLAHNKTLAAQLCSEFREFFPENAVEYFVSYYDYYQPEAYIPSTDTYIEKDSTINDSIDELRHSATSALSERRNVIIVASVSCIYSLGAPEDYRSMMEPLRPGMHIERDALLQRLVALQYERNDIQFVRNKFRVRGDVVEIFPANREDTAIRVEFFGDEIDRISEINVVTGTPVREDFFTLTKEAAKEKLGVNDGRPLIVSFWGSLGASGMNAQMADMLALEAGKEPFHHIHGAGKSGYAAVLKALAEKGVDLKDHPSLQVREYIYDMAPVMRAADLVICRAGASTVSELTALGVPAIMVPSPYVTNNHQEKNARALETHGGVEVLLEQDSSGQALFQTAAGILRDDARREAMASAMAELGIRDAAQRIYETVQELL